MISYFTPQTLPARPPQFPASSHEPFEITALTKDYFHSDRNIKQQPLVEMIWLTQGNFKIMTDLNTLEIKAGMIMFALPGQTFCVSPNIEIQGLVVRFPAGFIPSDNNSFYPDLSYCMSRIFKVDALATTSLMRLMQCIRQELAEIYNQRTEVLCGYIRIVLINLLRQPSFAHQSAFKADMALLAKRFFDLLELRYHVNKKVKEYADELAVTPNYLNQIVKQETGMSASANIRKRLLLQAKRMAIVEGVSMKAIAYKLGFEDTAHFSKFFKLGCGCNFSDYRKTCPANI